MASCSASGERWIHNDELPLLVRVALGHYQFETIHPYTDGNGRLGRLVAVLQLIEDGLMRHHLMTISGYVRGVAIQIAEDLIGYPLLTVTDLQPRYGVTYQTANLAVSRLVELGVLVQVSEGNYNRVFAAMPVLDVFRP